MPLFMDRHDIGAATAEELAQAHHQDIAIQERHSCRAITYWHDEARGTAFCSTVNLTSRICDCAEPGQIIAARVVKELCLGKDVTFKSLGSKTLKGFDDATHLELVEWRE